VTGARRRCRENRMQQAALYRTPQPRRAVAPRSRSGRGCRSTTSSTPTRRSTSRVRERRVRDREACQPVRRRGLRLTSLPSTGYQTDPASAFGVIAFNRTLDQATTGDRGTAPVRRGDQWHPRSTRARARLLAKPNVQALEAGSRLGRRARSSIWGISAAVSCYKAATRAADVAAAWSRAAHLTAEVHDLQFAWTVSP
jgi:hypothetical protein